MGALQKSLVNILYTFYTKVTYIFQNIIYFSFFLTGHNSNKPTAKWNPVSAKGLDERGFL